MSHVLLPRNTFLPVTVDEFRCWSEAPPESNVCQSEHAALMTTCITPASCHPNSELPSPHPPPAHLKLERLGAATTQQRAPPPPRPPLTLWLRVRLSKDNMFFWLPKQTTFPCCTCAVSVRLLSWVRSRSDASARCERPPRRHHHHLLPYKCKYVWPAGIVLQV